MSSNVYDLCGRQEAVIGQVELIIRNIKSLNGYELNCKCDLKKDGDSIHDEYVERVDENWVNLSKKLEEALCVSVNKEVIS